MKKISNQLRNIDFFSVTYTPAISDGLTYNHSSILGGIISLIIGILSLIYCIYYLYMWWSYSLLPKVTEDINNFTDDSNFGFLNNHMQVTANDINGQSPINPFKIDEIVLLPLLLDLDEGLNWKPLISNITKDQILDINFKMSKDKQYMILFTLCKEEYLIDDYQCASEEVKQSYFKQLGNTLYTDVEFTTINPSTFEPQSYYRTYPIYVHSNAEMCSSINLHYQMNNYLIDKSFLFSTGVEEQNYISNSLNYPQYAMKDYCDKYYMPNTYGAFWVLFQQQYHTIQIGYPSISEVLAAIGSIISILFSVKYVITLLNLTQMRQTILDDIMRQYYPEIKQFKIIKNLWGKIISVKYHSVQVEISSYLSFQKQIHSQMACKLNYKNLLYEMSRFQFILMSFKRRREIERFHHVGIKVPIKLSESGEQYTISEGIQNQLRTLNLRHQNTIATKYDILTMNDALILSQEYKNNQLQEGKSEFEPLQTTNQQQEEQDREQEFYEINYIKPSNDYDEINS